MMDHPFWFLITMSAVAWYCSVTIYVAVRGFADIKGMLSRLKGMGEEELSEVKEDQ
jgi:hypothetical protein